jgi:hypothetical protein
VPLQLADDRRRRVSRERPAQAGLEPIDRVQQSDRCHLNKVRHRLGRMHVTVRQFPGERHEPFDQFLTGRDIALLVVDLK